MTEMTLYRQKNPKGSTTVFRMTQSAAFAFLFYCSVSTVPAEA